MAEVLIGKHCEVHDCKQVDFLPFTCDGCSKVFCLEHRSKDGHDCTEVDNNIFDPSAAREPAETYACTVAGCRGKELVPVRCKFCSHMFCLSHRHGPDHDCISMPPSEKTVPMAETTKMVKQIQDRQQSKPSCKKVLKTEKARKMAAKVALMKMKVHAQGDTGIPQIDRVHFEVTLPARCKCSHKPFFVSAAWSVGRVVDWLANINRLENHNNLQGAEKLRLFHPNTSIAFPMDSKMRVLLEREDNPLYSGGEVVLEYVPDGSDQLEENS